MLLKSSCKVRGHVFTPPHCLLTQLPYERFSRATCSLRPAFFQHTAPDLSTTIYVFVHSGEAYIRHYAAMLHCIGTPATRVTRYPLLETHLASWTHLDIGLVVYAGDRLIYG